MLEFLLFCAALAVPCLAQLPRVPDIEAQRAAMKKLSFLIGKWSGEARLQRRPGEPLEPVQTEDAQYKLDGLVPMIRGHGRNKSDGKIALQAFTIVSQSFLTTTRLERTACVPIMRAYHDVAALPGDRAEASRRAAERPGASRWATSKPAPCCESMKKVSGPNSLKSPLLLSRRAS